MKACGEKIHIEIPVQDPCCSHAIDRAVVMKWFCLKWEVAPGMPLHPARSLSGTSNEADIALKSAIFNLHVSCFGSFSWFAGQSGYWLKLLLAGLCDGC